MKVSAIICAAGRGERAGFGKNKLLAPLCGAPALYHTLKQFDIPEIDEVIVTSSAADAKEIKALCAPFGFKVVPGGKTRYLGVRSALEKVTGDIVLIHDGARPFVTKKIITDCIKTVEVYGSGVCALPATDTTVLAAAECAHTAREGAERADAFRQDHEVAPDETVAAAEGRGHVLIELQPEQDDGHAEEIGKKEAAELPGAYVLLEQFPDESHNLSLLS